jgi:hypothetical protein
MVVITSIVVLASLKHLNFNKTGCGLECTLGL